MIRNEKILIPIGFLILTAFLLGFIFTGKTIGTVAQQMLAQYPWKSMVAQDYPKIKVGYPATDFGDSFYPNWQFLTDSLREGTIPLWLPHDFGGSRAIETGLLGFYYPVRFILASFLPTIVQHNVILFSHLLIALLAMYFLLRFLRCSISGAVYGAIVWSLNGHVIFYISLQFVLIYAAFLPLALLSAAKAILTNSKKWAILCGFSVGLMSFGGYANYLYVSLGILACWYLYFAVQKFRSSNWSVFLLPAISAIIALLAGAAYWLPFLDVLADLARRPRTLEEQITSSLPVVEALRGILWPKSITGPIWSPLDFASLLFAGPFTVLLCFAALWQPTKKKVLSFIGFLLAFLFIVGFRPIYILGHKILPGFGALHPFSNGAYLFSFFAAILSAFGLTIIMQGTKLAGNKPILLVRRLFGVGLIVTLVASSFLLLRESQPIQPTDKQWLYPSTPLTDKLNYLQEQTKTRMIPVYNPKTGQPIFFGRSHGMADLNSILGYESLPTIKQYLIISSILNYGITPDLDQRTIVEFVPALTSDRVPVRLLGIFSVRYVVSPPDTGIVPIGNAQDDQLKLSLVYAGKDGLIWENEHALPRAFVADKITYVSSDQEALSKVLAPDFNPQSTSIISAEKDSSHDALSLDLVNTKAAVEFIEDGVNSIRLNINAQSQSLLVLNDTWAPGWRAYVNGKRTPVLRANFAYRGVMIPAGVSEVAFVYRPFPLIMGIFFTSLSICGAVIYFAFAGLKYVLKFFRGGRWLRIC